ncbi:WD repeat-containing protein 76-like isoform X2 [Branchiostoma floridae]|uniref:WD repeat-containing protein 76 n=1 Tax=Branchiostoma floridae TaxID=7739 RepID=A0A9J7MK91_BRAFL|nr:WD repeat-containing protein 76-like isoform X2 [Branchiostoma floridae]
MPTRSKRSLASNDRKSPRISKQAKVEVVIVDKSPSKYSTASSDSIPISKLKQRNGKGRATRTKETPASKQPPKEAQKVLFSKSRKIISSDEEDEDSRDEKSSDEEWSSEEETSSEDVSKDEEELSNEESTSSDEEWGARGPVKRKTTKPIKAAKAKKTTKPRPKKASGKAKACPKDSGKDTDAIIGANLDSDSDDDIPCASAGQYLSEYEKKRLQNIQENAAFFESIDLQSAKNNLSDVSTKKSARPRGLTRRKWEHPEVPPPRPRSLRLQNKNPEGVQLPPKPEPVPLYQDMHVERAGPTYRHFFVQKHSSVRRGLTGKHKGTPFGPRKPAGPLDMAATNVKGDGKGLADSFQQELHRLAKTPIPKGEAKERLTVTQESFLKSVQSMAITEERVAKVTPERIFSVAVHPSTTKMLVCAGDKWGRLGLWDVESQEGEDGVYSYNPHSRPINCLQFSPVHHGKLYMCSYDGTMRCAEFEKNIFSEVFSTEEGTDQLVKYFDFLSEDGTTCLVGLGDGDVAVVDTRTKGTEAEHLYPAHDRTIKTVSVHPTQRHYFVTCCNDSNVYIYDLRNMKKKGSQQFVASLYQHTRSVSSAYFSPASGSRILTTCFDDRIRLFDTKVIGQPTVKPLREIRHNNQTGRWLTPLRAVWVPGRDDLFVSGSMKQPRQMELFDDKSTLLHTYTDPDYLTSICSIIAFHPTQFLLAGGNSSGRMHVFSASSFSATSKKSPGSPRVVLKKMSV